MYFGQDSGNQVIVYQDVCIKAVIVYTDGVVLRCDKVEKSRTFRREGVDIHSDVVVSLSQAILGGTVRVPGINDHILLNVGITL